MEERTDIKGVGHCIILKFLIFKEKKITKFKWAITVLLLSARTAFGIDRLTSVYFKEK